MEEKLKYKKLPDRYVTTTTITKQIEIEGIVFDATSKLCNLLEELESCDGYFERLNITGDVGKKLEKLGVASKSNRGSYSPHNKKKLKEFKELICDVAYTD